MLLPKLKQGDTVAVFSPSSPATKTAVKRYARGKAYLESRGFKVLEGSLTGKQDFYRSGSIAARSEELNSLIRNPNVQCIMAAIGGNNSNSLLPYIDYDAFKKNPKILVGYSDVTALLLGVFEKTGITTYYGPAMVASFGEFPPFVHETFDSFMDMVGENQKFPFTLPTPPFWTDEFLPWEEQDRGKTSVKNELITFHGGAERGRLIGGNLNTMEGIWGTPYMPQIKKGDILLIEDSKKDAATLERSFAHLKLSGIFEKIGGLILGKHEGFEDLGTNRRPLDILSEVMGEISFPLLADFDCCHTFPMLTLPIGGEVLLDADKKTVTVL